MKESEKSVTLDEKMSGMEKGWTLLLVQNTANIYLIKVNIRNTRRRSGVFIANFEYILHLFLVFLLLTLIK